jgi:hypothetical protein
MNPGAESLRYHRNQDLRCITMTPQNAKAELERRIELAGTPMPELTLAQGIRLMTDFYRDARADKCNLEEDGDMLLFQWGGGQGSFECDITRQFIVSQSEGEDEDEEDDSAMSQLSFTFNFAPSPQFGGIKSGNHWCYSPEALADLEAFINSSDVFRVAQGMRPAKVTLDYGEV